MVSIVNMQG